MNGEQAFSSETKRKPRDEIPIDAVILNPCPQVLQRGAIENYTFFVGASTEAIHSSGVTIQAVVRQYLLSIMSQPPNGSIDAV